MMTTTSQDSQDDLEEKVGYLHYFSKYMNEVFTRCTCEMFEAMERRNEDITPEMIDELELLAMELINSEDKEAIRERRLALLLVKELKSCTRTPYNPDNR